MIYHGWLAGSVALPTWVNTRKIKHILLIFLEFVVNIQSNFNKVIISSFIEIQSYQLSKQLPEFYPCYSL